VTLEKRKSGPERVCVGSFFILRMPTGYATAAGAAVLSLNCSMANDFRADSFSVALLAMIAAPPTSAHTKTNCVILRRRQLK
jgi:hypothetical protein